jgi:hypothetical protein
MNTPPEGRLEIPELRPQAWHDLLDRRQLDADPTELGSQDLCESSGRLGAAQISGIVTAPACGNAA